MKTKGSLTQTFLLAAALPVFNSNAQPVIISQPTNQIAIYGGSARFSVMATGVGPFTYQWRLNGTNLANNIITTVAGNGTNNFSGDGGPAINAGLNQPWGVSLDATNNILIADTGNNRIRRVDVNGTITTVAGKGTSGYSGDGGTATNAMLNQPRMAFAGAAGNLYIADYGNSRVRMLSTNGTITTVAGNANAGFGKDGYAATNSTWSSLNGPTGVALALTGEMYISDENNHRIRKVGTNGIMSTVAGNAVPPYLYPAYSGDGGPATNAALAWPPSAMPDNFGAVYIADQSNDRIRIVGTNGIINTVAGNGTYGSTGDGGPATNAALGAVSCACPDKIGGFYIASYSVTRIRYVDSNGSISTVAGTSNSGYGGDGGPATNATFTGQISWVALDQLGNLYISDSYNNRIREVHYSGLPTLALNKVGVANAGNYSVVITSASGSVTSSVASLALVLPPIAPAFNPSNGIFSFTWSAVSNAIYQLQSATNLVAPVWLDLGSPLTATSNSVTATDVIGADGQRFYRVRLWP